LLIAFSKEDKKIFFADSLSCAPLLVIQVDSSPSFNQNDGDDAVVAGPPTRQSLVGDAKGDSNSVQAAKVARPALEKGEQGLLEVLIKHKAKQDSFRSALNDAIEQLRLIKHAIAETQEGSKRNESLSEGGINAAPVSEESKANGLNSKGRGGIGALQGRGNRGRGW